MLLFAIKPFPWLLALASLLIFGCRQRQLDQTEYRKNQTASADTTGHEVREFAEVTNRHVLYQFPEQVANDTYTLVNKSRRRKGPKNATSATQQQSSPSNTDSLPAGTAQPTTGTASLPNVALSGTSAVVLASADGFPEVVVATPLVGSNGSATLRSLSPNQARELLAKRVHTKAPHRGFSGILRFLAATFRKDTKILEANLPSGFSGHMTPDGLAILARVTEPKTLSEDSPAAQKFRRAMAGLTPDRVWKLSVDGNKHDKGHDVFESERGYNAAMNLAWTGMYATMTVPIGLELIEALHDLAVSGVDEKSKRWNIGELQVDEQRIKSVIEELNLQNAISPEKVLEYLRRRELIESREGKFLIKTGEDSPLPLALSPEPKADINHEAMQLVYQELRKDRQWLPQGIREGRSQNVRFDIEPRSDTHPGGTYTRAGIIETLGRTTAGGVLEGFSTVRQNLVIITAEDIIDNEYLPSVLTIYTHKEGDDLRQRINSITADYHKSLPLAKTDEAKLKVMIQTVQTLEQLHPFLDGNLRTFGILLLNRMLIENDMTPTILEDPNRFDGFSVDELIQEVRNGQQAFEAVKRGEDVSYPK